MIVTIDGPAGAGKSTVARAVARELGLPYLNSGSIYRAITLLGIERGGRFENRATVEDIIRNLKLRFVERSDRSPSGDDSQTTRGDGSSPSEATQVFVGDRDITTKLTEPAVTAQVYRVANDSGYRALLVDFQRKFAQPSGVVAEGRDMGTVIFPRADRKVYLDASAEERARRRCRELRVKGGGENKFDKEPAGDDAISYEEVLDSILVRDERDRQRQHAPLCVPEDAVVVDTDNKSVAEVVREVLSSVGVRRRE